MWIRRGAWGVRPWVVAASLAVTVSILESAPADSGGRRRKGPEGGDLRRAPGLNPAHQRGDLAGDHVM